ncbi:MAG TPA: hypothetical protein VLE73_05980 [Candidatus Saccharimonadales bacterium]|nr:hypothetical protein [Candidatus Saccharimonadales bacterium]
MTTPDYAARPCEVVRLEGIAVYESDVDAFAKGPRECMHAVGATICPLTVHYDLGTLTAKHKLSLEDFTTEIVEQCLVRRIGRGETI